MVKKSEPESKIRKLVLSAVPPIFVILGFILFSMVMADRFNYSASPYPRIERNLAIYGSIALVSFGIFLGALRVSLRSAILFGAFCFVFIALGFFLIKGPTFDAGAFSFTGEDILLYSHAFKILFPIGACITAIAFLVFMIDQGKWITGLTIFGSIAGGTWFFMEFIIL